MPDPTQPGAAPAVSLVLRLAGPLQSWGSASQFNRRETAGEPTKGGITGLLAAAQGRRRSDPIEDLLALRLAVRTDQAGTLLRDYHTVSDYRGVPLPSAAVNTKGVQKPAGDKHTHVTQRYYLQDAVFVAAVAGPRDLLGDLADALRRPAFPLALGRRSCVPALPLLLRPSPDQLDPGHPDLWGYGPVEVLSVVPWQAAPTRLRELERAGNPPARIDLPVTADDPHGDDVRSDVPDSFSLVHRGFASRRVRHTWARVSTPFPDGADDAGHDPFALLDW
jgi:CRISPR system Cascade subunit CasD